MGTTWLGCSRYVRDLFLWKMNINAIWFNERLTVSIERHTHTHTHTKFCVCNNFCLFWTVFFSLWFFYFSFRGSTLFPFAESCPIWFHQWKTANLLLLILYWEPSIKSICFVCLQLLNCWSFAFRNLHYQLRQRDDTAREEKKNMPNGSFVASLFKI